MARVRVRMYRQGLGDCFLLTFDTAEGTAHALIDCGVFMGTKKAKEKMAGVAANIREVTRGQLAVLVATHEHWDHVSGFLQAEDQFDGLGVDEVWVAWTENPNDDLAEELREGKKRAVKALDVAARRLEERGSAVSLALAGRVRSLLAFEGGVKKGRATVARAFQWVKDRPGAEMRFLRPGERPSALGVRAYVLGPPRDRKRIRQSDPSRRAPEVYSLAGDMGAERGFVAAVERTAGDESDDAGRRPFDASHALSDADAAKLKLFNDHYLSERERWRQIEHDWLGAAGRLALRLDSDTNNTSLVLAFELFDGGPVLLFPGDAQVGNWMSWADLRWQGGETGEVTAADLLTRTVLYKVGHHGSHNATLREKGLELMTSQDLVAMVPVDRVMAKKKRWDMPFPALHRRLVEKTHGRVIDAEQGIPGDRPEAATDQQWQAFLSNTDVQEGWIDYTIEW